MDKQSNDYTMIEYALSPRLRAFSTTRIGGHSQGNYATYNINPFCGDQPEAVAANRTKLCHELAIDGRHLFLPHQTHGTRTVCIDRALLEADDNARATALEGVDALITNLTGVCIGVSTADCVPVLLYDEEHHAAAAVHAGWRGTVARITAVAIEAMQTAYGTRPGALRAVIGPSISQAAFEVGDEVYQAFQTAGFPMQEVARRYSTGNGEEKWHIDLWAANVVTLTELGVDLGHIHVAGICTYTHADSFFSARKEGIRSGRMYSGILLK